MTASLRIRVLEILQWIGFAIVIAALPFSNFFISFGSFWLVGVFILQMINAHFTDKSAGKFLQEFKSEPLYWMPSVLYLLGLLGLLWTHDFKFASWDLRMKLPMLFMPFLVLALSRMNKRQVDWLFKVFITSLTISTIICLLVYFGFIERRVKNVRDISIFISHIRLSMLIVLALAITCHRWVCHGKNVVLSIVIALILIYFLWIIESLTGFIMIGALVFYFLVRSALISKERWFKWGVPTLIIAGALSCTIYVVKQYHDYFTPKDVATKVWPRTTDRGGVYTHYLENNQLENGHYIMRNIAWLELQEGWNQRSSIAFDSTDLKGNEVKWTLVRYLTSMGLRKDLDAMEELTEEDIENIEKGIPSYTFYKSSGIDRRLDKIFFELDNYRNGGSPNGHSVFQRFEFWKNAVHVFVRNIWIGVGTGDVKSEINLQYQLDGSSLVEKNRLRAHNQYLTYFVAVGILGGLLCLLALIYPLTRKWARTNLVFMSFYIICLLSFLTEDTLETQVGVTFYAFLYPFLLRYGREDKLSNSIR
ncbi:MAG: O-antigen ligase family protein [Flavobacteriales bacterium]